MYEIRISGAKAVFITLYTTLFYRKRGGRFNVEQVEIIKAGNKNYRVGEGLLKHPLTPNRIVVLVVALMFMTNSCLPNSNNADGDGLTQANMVASQDENKTANFFNISFIIK
jgi:hypothetical protein